jgi:hypothetical protein
MVNYVLGQQHPLINNLVPAIAPDLGENNRCALLGHNRHPNLPQTIEIKYAMSSGGPIKLQLLDKAGHVLRTLVDDYRNKGSYTFNFIAPQWFVGPGTYQYRLMSGGQVFQREIRI